MKIVISIGTHCTASKWRNKEMSWTDFLGILKRTNKTSETIEEYKRMSKSEQLRVKDCGGFVGGRLRSGLRKKGFVEERHLITLDADDAKDSIWDTLKQMNYTCCVYSTHKHTPEKPRLRLVFPISRPMTEEEYPAAARRLAGDLGIEQFDKTTYEPARLMFWPSTSVDGEYVFKYMNGNVLNPDEILARYEDWRDVSQWPVSSGEREWVKSESKKQADPKVKEGIVGAFCRAYDIEGTIEAFLPDVYEPCDSIPGRYSYIPADSMAGLVVYEGKYAYSHHASDPACGKLCNAFDLVRIHRFGNLDGDELVPSSKLPSFKAMLGMAAKDETVRKQLAQERMTGTIQEIKHEDWQTGLELNKKGEVADSLSNLILIVENDPNLKGIVFNEHYDGLEIVSEVPWKRSGKWWRDADDAQLISYIDKNYKVFSKSKYYIAVTKVADDRSYHPVREYLNSLPGWDGIPRVDTLLIHYFAAEDNDYIREVIRKTMCAAVARVFEPGIKFDYMLVLNGKQGLGKSTFLRRLGGAWFSDSLQLSDTHDKTAAEKLQGYWLLEIGEMAGMKKAEIETLKAFLSRQDDVYRASFGRRAGPHLRQCIFVGITNSDRGFLRDITGNRRFWPVKVDIGKKSPLDITAEEAQQIWAEVLVYYRNNEKLYLSGDVEMYAEEMQREAMISACPAWK